MLKYLAECYDYKVTSEDETVYLEKKGTQCEPVIIGDFYGNPRCAIILNEDYVVMGGCGMIIYKIEEPLEEYQYNTGENKQFTEMFRDPKDIWWILSLWQDSFDDDENLFYFVATNKEGNSLYKMNAATLELQKMGTFTGNN